MLVGDRFHLTYCSNIHPGETWHEVSAALRAALPVVRERLGVDGPFGIGLRLSARAAAALEQPEALAAFKAFLCGGNYYVFTINGFPYGAFHGERVKENVYLPDWRNDARLEYTNRLARLLADLLADRPDLEGSVSTVPGAFRTDITSEADIDAMASRILRHATELRRLRDRTGRTITLAIEPEPACFLETTTDAVTFFEDWLFDERRIAAIAREAGVDLTLADVRRHVGLCLDACHMAVEFEDASGALARLRTAGIRVQKVQISSAIRSSSGAHGPYAPALARFADDTYLHQVVERTDEGDVRYTDLPKAIAAARHASSAPREWRVHFHVPLFLADMQELGTTQSYAAELLALLRSDPVCPYLEVETYTWDVLPAEHRDADVCTAIARELAWVRGQLER